MSSRLRGGILLALSLLLLSGAAAQSLRLVERADWSRWKDGVYVGHAYREGRTTLGYAGPGLLRGDWYLFEETLRDLRAEAKALDRSGELSLRLGPLGALSSDDQAPLPSLRGLLDLGRAEGLEAPGRGAGLAGPEALALLRPGSAFSAPGLRVLLIRDAAYRLPFLAEYRVRGGGSYANRRTLTIGARFATRLAGPQGDLVGASGSHELDISLDAETGLPVFVRDRFDDSYVFADGGREREAGSTLVFWSGGDGMGSGELLAALAKSLGAEGGPAPPTSPTRPTPGAPGAPGAGAPGPAAALPPSPATPSGQAAGPQTAGEAAPAEASAGSAGAAESSEGSGILSAGPGALQGSGELPAAPSLALPPSLGLELGRGEGGVALRIKELRFKADTAILLPAEDGRLDLLAKALLAAPPDRSFLVEGHAAATGRPRGELELSAARAKAVVDALVARGIPASRFIWRGLGSSRPLASNDTEEGRAENRRVEITILD